MSRSKRSSYSISEENTRPLVLNDFESSGSIGLRSMGGEPTSAVGNGLFDDIATPTVDPATDITKQQSSLVQDALLKQQGKDELAKRLQQSQGRDSKVQHVNPEPRRSTTEGHSNSYSNSDYSDSSINYEVEIGIGADDIVEINEKSMSSTLENLASGGMTGPSKRSRRSISRAVKATLKPGVNEPSIWEADSTLFNTRQSSFEPVDPVTGEKLPSEAALERVLSESIYRRAEGAQKSFWLYTPFDLNCAQQLRKQ